MNANTHANRLTLSDLEYQRLSDLVFSIIGIKMPKTGQIIMSARLRGRLRVLGMGSFSEYLTFVSDPKHGAEELVYLTDRVTTNTTEFFREPHHFNFLTQTALPTLIKDHGAGIDRPLLCWSAACSSGEEPYTIGMVLSEFGRKKLSGSRLGAGSGSWKFQIKATDISNNILEKAKTAVYKAGDVGSFSLEMKRRYLLKGKDPAKPQVKIAPTLRDTVKFDHLNLVDDPFSFLKPMDFIFCRNVLIYFEDPIKEKIIQKFSRCLVPGGYLFIGNSESLNGMDVPFKLVATTTYQRTS